MERSPNFAFHKQPAGPRNCPLAVCVLLGVSGAGLALVKHDKSDPEACQSAFKFDPVSASNFDPFERRVLAVALAPSELVGVAETVRARVA
jgi:hypothetical protein